MTIAHQPEVIHRSEGGIEHLKSLSPDLTEGNSWKADWTAKNAFHHFCFVKGCNDGDYTVRIW